MDRVTTQVYIHPTAEVSRNAHVGTGSRIWNQAQIREEVRIGCDCVIGKGAYVDRGVVLGDGVKVQNNVSIYHGVIVEDGVFIGPHVCFTNDLRPRALTMQGTLKSDDDWLVGRTVVRRGASIGAGVIIVANVTIGAFALVGAGSVVTRSVPAQALMYGNPARQYGYVCRCGQSLGALAHRGDLVVGTCPACQQEYVLQADRTAGEPLPHSGTGEC